MTTPKDLPRYFRVERLNARTGQWRQISPEGMGSLDACKQLYAKTARTMKRGTIRVMDNHGVQLFWTTTEHDQVLPVDPKPRALADAEATTREGGTNDRP